MPVWRAEKGHLFEGSKIGQYHTSSEYLEVHNSNGSRSFSNGPEQSSSDGVRRRTRGKLSKREQEEW
jgi:hypothetical protein